MDKPSDKDLADFLLWKAFTKDIDPMREKNWSQDEALLLKQAQQNQGVVKTKVPQGGSETIKPPKESKQSVRQDIDFQLDRRTEEKLRKGKIPIDGTLDLHGLNQSQAHMALERAVLRAISQNKRCLLVITGKGKTGKTGADWLAPAAGVLKTRVPQWLSVPPLSYEVLKYTDARPEHGGTGALYVYLRRQR